MKKLILLLVLIASGPAILSASTGPTRIVVAGGDLTEIVYALGAGDRIVGVDSTSRYPDNTQQKEQIGYVRRISAEGVLSLSPDLVLGAHDMGPPASVEQLRLSGVNVAVSPGKDTLAGVIQKIRFVGAHIGLENEARTLADRIEADLDKAIADAAAISKAKRVIFALAVGDSGVIVGGDDTGAAEIIRLAGGINAASGFSGYKPMSREAIMEAQPDIILMMNGRGEGHGGPAGILERTEFKLTPAARNKALITMDGMLLLGFGPRTPMAIAELSRAINH